MMKKILVTGGAGFVGSNLAIALKENFENCEVIVLDNLYRQGSELNIPRLESVGITFINGDIRKVSDLNKCGKFDFLIECSAEPSVLAGKNGDTSYLIQTNLQGALNCVELCRQYDAGMLFLSTSRVYPIKPQIEAELIEMETRFELSDNQKICGYSAAGIAENFPMNGERSLYGGTKYAAEIMLEEYRSAFSLPIIINRSGVIAGPWQFGKADQGIAAFWIASHLMGKKLKYIGFGGSGKQVRDMLHIDDLIRLVLVQLASPEKFSQGVFNIGGGRKISASLLELTQICQKITGKTIPIGSEPETRYADIPVYLSDNSKIKNVCSWQPEKNIETLIEDIHNWLLQTPAVHELF
jgi:CDP-paratose 2-epimerase